MRIGYARVSTDAQDYSGQVALKAAGCDRIVSEKISAATLDRRSPVRLIAELAVVVTRLDRLARSTRDLDIDLDAGTISVTRNVEETAKHGRRISTPKAKNSVREFQIEASLVAMLCQERERHLQLRADHLRIVLRATADYVGALMHDTAYFSHAVQIERKRLDGIFEDVIGDLCGTIEKAADRVREERAEQEA
jgi:hypothetical protein